MAAIRGKDTRAEKLVRSLIHRLGLRFRLHRRDLPGRPDIVLPRHSTVIEVRGCFWHMHSCRWGSVIPASNSEFWREKREGNVERDKRNLCELKKLGWRVIVIWECEARDVAKLEARLIRLFRL